MVLEDGTLVLGQQGQAVWTRPDGLASVRATMFMDLPSSQELAEERRDVPSVLDAFRDRLHFEFLNVKVGHRCRWPEAVAAGGPSGCMARPEQSGGFGPDRICIIERENCHISN